MTYPVAVVFKALELVAMGLTDDEVAAQIRISRKTVERWRKLPENLPILADCRRELIDRLEENAKLATAHLKGVLTDSKEDPNRQMTSAIQALKAHSKAVQAGAAKKIGDAIAEALTPDQLQARREEVLTRLAKLPAPVILDVDADDGDPIH